jgi:hypothetical protein
MWVDASTSFGIGVVIDKEWEAWKFLPGWDSHPQHKIGWAETIALECGIQQLIHLDIHNSHVIVKSDNMGVIGALAGGKSWNAEQNIVLQRITTLLRTHSLWVSTIYTPSALNLADPPSQGIAPDNMRCFSDIFTLSDILTPTLLPKPVLAKLKDSSRTSFPLL